MQFAEYIYGVSPSVNQVLGTINRESLNSLFAVETQHGIVSVRVIEKEKKRKFLFSVVFNGYSYGGFAEITTTDDVLVEMAEKIAYDAYALDLGRRFQEIEATLINSGQIKFRERK
jgi:hypothetical protein